MFRELTDPYSDLSPSCQIHSSFMWVTSDFATEQTFCSYLIGGLARTSSAVALHVVLPALFGAAGVSGARHPR